MFRRPVLWLPAAVLALLLGGLLAAPGCQLPARRTVPFNPPDAQRLLPADEPCPEGRPVAKEIVLASAEEPVSDWPMRRPRNILALSGGGVYGAFSAGFLNGWTRSGTRPEFDVVTGISTGALIAPLAFLGPDYDTRLSQLYTRVQAEDIFRIHAWVAIPFQDSVASSAPLKALIESEITQDLMSRIAAEHRKGRRLYVGTTNLDTRRLVVWDMGAIACRPCPEGCRLFRDVLLASCAVPGMFPPVQFEVEVDGRKATELHADGGVTAQLFVPSHVFAAAAQAAITDASRPGPPPGADPMPPAGNLYVIVSGKFYPDATPVRAKVLPVLAATTGAIIYAHCRADLANLYGLSRAAGLRYHLASLPQGFRTVDVSVKFDQKEMTRLYHQGMQQGSAPDWMGGPPTLSPGDGDPVRTGLRMRTPPPPISIPPAPGN